MAKIGKPKSTPICPFLFHLYHSRDILTEEKEIDYEAAKELMNYRITPDPEPQSNLVSEGEDQEAGNPDETTEVLETEEPQRKLNRLKQLKKTYQTPHGSPPVQSRRERSQLSAQPDHSQQEKGEKEEGDFAPWIWKPFKGVFDSLSSVNGQYQAMEQALVDMSKELGIESLKAVEYVKTLPKP